MVRNLTTQEQNERIGRRIEYLAEQEVLASSVLLGNIAKDIDSGKLNSETREAYAGAVEYARNYLTQVEREAAKMGIDLRSNDNFRETRRMARQLTGIIEGGVD